MTQERRPPSGFMTWLAETYGDKQAIRLYNRYMKHGWESDKYYQHWEQNVKSPETPLEAQPTKRKLPDFLEGELEFISTLEELEQLLLSWITSGYITQEQAGNAYETHALRIDPYTYLGVPEDVKQDLGGFTSEKDLADRITRLGLDESIGNQLYQGILSGETAASKAMRAAGGRGVTAQEQAQLSREERAGYLSEALSSVYNDPLITQQDLAGIRESLAGGTEAFLTGQSDDIMMRLGELKQQVAQRSAREGQTADALLASMRRPGAAPKREELPAIPGAKGVAESFLEGTKLGKGTKLREFIASEIPDIWEGTRAAREKWWRKMHEPVPDLETLESARGRLTAEAGKWARIGKAAPTSEIAGGTYYGPGGLKAIAQRAYEYAQQNLAGLRPEDYPSGQVRPGFDIWGDPIGGEDPFLAELRKRRFKTEYYRQPGAGLARRLTPAARW